jgi:hypothetical protein
MGNWLSAVSIKACHLLRYRVRDSTHLDILSHASRNCDLISLPASECRLSRTPGDLVYRRQC